MQFIEYIKLLYVSAPTCHLQGVIAKECKPNTLVQVLNCPYRSVCSYKILKCIKNNKPKNYSTVTLKLYDSEQLQV